MRQLGWLLATTLLVIGCGRDERKATTEGSASTVTTPSGTMESATTPALPTEAPVQPEAAAPALAPPVAPEPGAATGTPGMPAAQPTYPQPGTVEPVPTAPTAPPVGAVPAEPGAPPAGPPPGGPAQPTAPMPPASDLDDIKSDRYDRPSFGQAVDSTKAKARRVKAKADRKADEVERDVDSDIDSAAMKARLEAEQAADKADTIAPDVTTPAPSGVEPYSAVPAPSTPGAPALETPPQAQDDMWKQEDRSIMGAGTQNRGTRYGMKPEKPRHLKVPGGMSVLAGGGAGGFVTDAATSLTGVSGTYNLRVIYGTRTPIAFEAAYIGSAQSIDALGLDSDALLIANGVEASARYNFLRNNQWQPFVTAGAAWKHYDIRSDANTSSILEDDDVLEIPVQAGVSWRRKGFLVDGRVGYRQAFSEDLLGDEELHNWGANVNLGIEF